MFPRNHNSKASSSPAVASNMPQTPEKAVTQLGVSKRSVYAGGKLKGGNKATYNPLEHSKNGETAVIDKRDLLDLSKIKLEIPPNSVVTVVMTMSDSSERRISFENTGDAEIMVGRLYLDSRNGKLYAAQGDPSDKNARDRKREAGPANSHFGTYRKLTDVSKFKVAVLEGDATTGAKFVPAQEIKSKPERENEAAAKGEKK